MRVLLLIAVAACDEVDASRPGTDLGEYSVSATPLENTCGAPFESAGAWTFTIELSRDGDKLYWVQGRDPIEGTIDASRNVRFKSESNVTLRAIDARTRRPACIVKRLDDLTGTVEEDSKGQVSRLKGALKYTLSITEGSECDAADWGDFASIPCNASFSFDSTKKK